MMVIDAVPFFNENPIWQLRYETLVDVVDEFVVVEARHTHAGKRKDLVFKHLHTRTGSLMEALSYNVNYYVTDLPEPVLEETTIPATRRREMFQRNAIVTAIMEQCPYVSDDDIILLSDCDEIPNPEVVKALRENGIPDGHAVIFRQRLCYYNLNTSGGYVWQGTRAVTWRDMRALSPHIVRYGIGQPDQHYPRYLTAYPGGWHLSYFGGPDAVRTKLTSFLHQELVNPEVIANAEAQIAAGQDVYGRENMKLTRERTTDVPPPVLKHPERWRWMYHEDYRHG